MNVASVEVIDTVGVITIDSPPVNALGVAVRQGIESGMMSCLADDRVQAIVLICAGRTFFAGADISEFGKPLQHPDFNTVLGMIDNSRKLVVAAIHGTALGGGLETALVCHYRIAVPSAQVGLPEVNLGLLPGAGGTQRLPRIVGVEAALDIITGGKPIRAERALQLGMIDALAGEGKLREDAVAFARQLIAQGRPLPRVRDRDDKLLPARGKPEIYETYLDTHAQAFRGFKAPYNIVKAIEAAVELPFDEGLKRETELFDELHDSAESAAQRYYFFAERETARIPGIGKDVPALPVRLVGVIGAGTMGGGIAMNFLNAGIPITLVEADQGRLDRGLDVIRANYENSAKKGRLTAAQVEERMGLIRPSLSLEDLADVDLAIEAVFEEIAVKKDIFAKLDRVTRPGAILASNTSFLDLDEIAAATSRPEDVVGLHFFSPANAMRLLEVVRGKNTRKEIIATAMALARKIGKVPVLSGVGYGFIANRVMAARMDEANALVLEGPSPAEIDKALYEYGFAMGPFQMLDLVGLDVIGRDKDERSLASDLVRLGRLGQKQNGGFYDYDAKRKPTPSAVAAQVIADFSAFKGVKASGPFADEAIVARLLYPVVNEGAKVLEEGIALRASDIDVACILGYGWPVYTGGPMFWADTIGLQTIVAGLEAQNIRPARLLVEKAASGGSFTR